MNVPGAHELKQSRAPMRAAQAALLNSAPGR